MAALLRIPLRLAAVAGILAGLSCESLVAPEPNTPIGLRVWADVSPTTLSMSDSAAMLRIRVYVENSARDTLRITSGGPPYVFTGDPTRSRGLEESFRIASATDSLNAGPNDDYWGNAVYVFAPRTVTYTEDAVTVRQWRSGGWPLTPGPLRVRSWFNGHEGSSAAFTVVP